MPRRRGPPEHDDANEDPRRPPQQHPPWYWRIRSIYGLGGNDVIFGESGDDTIYGGAGRDKLFGSFGNDTFILLYGEGADEIDGGSNSPDYERDILVADWSRSSSPTIFDLRDTDGDGVHILPDGTTVRGIERFEITAGAGDDRLIGSTGHDVLDGGAGDDTLLGGDGMDELISRNSGDVIEGGAGVDLLVLDRRGTTQALVLDLRDPSLTQTLADGTTISGMERVDFYGGSGNDVILGGAWAMFYPTVTDSDTIYGEDGDDEIRVMSGSAHGGNGNDLLVSVGGFFLEGGYGNDVLRNDGVRKCYLVGNSG
ncbi:calcium-binding protein, partial [Methylobrevis pamukkalensis]|uniref:calcium-binding protein n=1 Tax=Methylobrevis pamukkalensis TaxID=1439726 RepID=UPI002478227C